MPGRFIITTAKNGEYTFNLKASNGEIILAASETYTSMDACKNGVESVRTNALAGVEDQTRGESLTHPKYELYLNDSGEFRFRLKARNGEIIGVSEAYKAKASARKGIASIGKNAPEAAVVVVEPKKPAEP